MAAFSSIAMGVLAAASVASTIATMTQSPPDPPAPTPPPPPANLPPPQGAADIPLPGQQQGQADGQGGTVVPPIGSDGVIGVGGPALPPGVSYSLPVKDRDTGGINYLPTNSNQSGSQARRNAWGQIIKV